MIDEYWEPTDLELKNLIDICLPLDSSFGDRVFELVEKNRNSNDPSASCLNVFYEVQGKLAEKCPASFISFIEGYEMGLEDAFEEEPNE